MVFSSPVFLLAFLPLVLAAYHLLFVPVHLGWRPVLWRRLANLLLLSVSLLFYFWGETFWVWIIIASTAVDYVCGLLISGAYAPGLVHALVPQGKRNARQKLGLVLSICTNLAFLCYFKYIGWGTRNVMVALEAWDISATGLETFLNIHLPLGISFYTFQSMSYTIDVYRGRVRATRNVIDFCCYVTLFPQLVAGPIVRYRDVHRQLTHRVVSTRVFASGVQQFIVGLGKKVLIANTVAVAADEVFALGGDQLTTPLAWLGIVAYTLQIYFDFSGYSDMAIGLGRMLGFEFMANFNVPYIARSIQEFWRRWHISLSTWFRDYLYIPLGGSRRSSGRTYANLVTVFFLCGLWHGAGWPFVIWGLFHGLFLSLERMGLAKVIARSRVVGHVYTLAVVMAGWVLFRCDTLGEAGVFFRALAGAPAATGSVGIAHYLTNDLLWAIGLGVVFSTPVVGNLIQRYRLLQAKLGPRRALAAEIAIIGGRTVGLVALLLACLMWLAAGTYNPFIYFRF